MDPKPFLHQHYLIFDFFPHLVECCDACNNQIEGWGLYCKSCNFWLHHTCAQQKLPSTILYPFHSHQNLTLLESNAIFVCDECVTLSSGLRYSCKDCSFNLDLICSSSTNSQTTKDITRKIKHFSHMDSLTLFIYREVGIDKYCCSWCGMSLSGMSYGCLFCKYFLHKSCLSKIPNKILSHPFHPSHPLYMQNRLVSMQNRLVSTCHACSGLIFGFSYGCCQSGCNYNFHIECINLKPTLKHECHQHSLIYFLVKVGVKITCNKCGLYHADTLGLGQQGQAFYGCVQCEFKVSLECLIPCSVEHRYHGHSLSLGRGREDNSGEYYCDICEEQRNPKHHVYYCKICTYVAHIECALDMLDHGLSYYRLKHEEAQQSDVKIQTNGQIDYFDHDHPLSFNESIDKNDCFCNACELNICEEAGYVCESCRNYFLHEACSKLPKELLHPLHSHHPPLVLLNIQKTLIPTVSICDKCRYVIRGFIYTCFDCDFKLDIKCATTFSITNEKHELRNQIEGRQVKFLHFSHQHELVFGYCNSPYMEGKKLYCAACNSFILSGPAYFCTECIFCLHESCLSKLPKNIQIPYHPHTLYPFFQGHPSFRRQCCLCENNKMISLRYRCSYRDLFETHYLCAGSLMRPLKSKHHMHDLHFLHKSLANFKVQSNCGRCNEFCGKDESIYCCIVCKINFHINCAGVPSKVKSKYHIHSVIFQDRFIEDDSGDYFCDICEKERDPNLAAYYCEECQGRFVAHIECILNEAGEVH